MGTTIAQLLVSQAETLFLLNHREVRARSPKAESEATLYLSTSSGTKEDRVADPSLAIFNLTSAFWDAESISVYSFIIYTPTFGRRLHAANEVEQSFVSYLDTI